MMRPDRASRCGWRLPILLLASFSAFPACNAARGQDVKKDGGADKELQIHWQYFQRIEIPANATGLLADVVLGPSVFTSAREDLEDLRLYDKGGRIVPYALRVDRSEDYAAVEFNRARGADGATELTLDLLRDDIEHDRVEAPTEGVNFRRKVVLEGGSDAKSWSTLATTHLFRFQRGDKILEDNAVSYPPSRFRYLRIRVFPDPVVDKEADKEPVKIGQVKVVRKVAVVGEALTLKGKLGRREAVRVDGRSGSAWVIDLGGEKVPCEEIEVEADDSEFARDYRIEWAGPPGSKGRFLRAALTSDGFWRRRRGEEKKPVTATFHEVRAARLRLLVIDDRNDPLKLGAVRFRSPARQVVFERPQEANPGLRLLFGNPKGEKPNYDFARNLPAQLDPPPVRAKLGDREANPGYEPQLALTERWPWLIYVVLGAVTVVLAAIIVSLARAAIARHDQQQGQEAAASGTQAGAERHDSSAG